MTKLEKNMRKTGKSLTVSKKEGATFSSLRANVTKWSNTLKQFVGCC